jgi:hypothetical protein
MVHSHVQVQFRITLVRLFDQKIVFKNALAYYEIGRVNEPLIAFLL